MKKLGLFVMILFFSQMSFSESNSGCSAISCLPHHMAKMTNDTAQTVETHEWEIVNFDNERYDLGDIASILDDEITIRRNGVYSIKASFMIRLTDGLTQINEYCGIIVRLNNGGYLLNNQTMAGKDGNCYSSVTGDYLLNAGDKLRMEIVQTSGASKNTLTTIDRTPTLSIKQL